MRIEVVILALLLCSCGKEREKQAVTLATAHSADSSDVSGGDAVIRTTNIPMVSYPLRFDSIPFDLHILGEYRLRSSRSKIIDLGSYSGSGSSASGFAIHSANDQVYGPFYNVSFENRKNGSYRRLNESNLYFESLHLLKTKKSSCFLYVLRDVDTNNDGELNQNDRLSYYLSKTDGSKFTCLSTKGGYPIDWQLDLETESLRFRTISDRNKNNEFDPEDLGMNYLVDLNSTNFNVEQVNPFSSKMK